LQVALSALLRGYRIFREPYANRLDIDADELDERVSGIMRTFLESVADGPSKLKARSIEPPVLPEN
jgi:hypothetical protein